MGDFYFKGIYEKVFWRKVLEIYATRIDYDPKAETSILFFKQVQNKMHWADADKDNMGLTSWTGGEIRRSDIEVVFLFAFRTVKLCPIHTLTRQVLI